MKKVLFLIVAIFSLGACLLRSATVTAEAGNIFLVSGDGKKIQLTNAGLDSEPVLAPDGTLIVFIRQTSLTLIAAGSGKAAANELWLIEPSGKNARRIVKAKASEDMKQLLAGLSSPVFTPDSKKVYFLSAAWVTSNAVHSVDLATQRIGFIVAGNSLELAQSGKYSGDLIVQQHRYWLAGGSYDWFWLFEPSGQEVGAIGEDSGLANFRETYLSEAK